MNTHDLPSKSLQEVFDFVCTKLIEQGKGSLGRTPDYDSVVCLYRSEAGKCAAGHLISDEDYREVFENVTIDNLQRQGIGLHLGLALVSQEMMNFISSLQSAHDVAALGGNFLSEFTLNSRKVAYEYELNTEVLGAE